MRGGIKYPPRDMLFFVKALSIVGLSELACLSEHPVSHQDGLSEAPKFL